MSPEIQGILVFCMIYLTFSIGERLTLPGRRQRAAAPAVAEARRALYALRLEVHEDVADGVAQRVEDAFEALGFDG